MKCYKKWACKEVDRYVKAHALDSDPEKLMDLQLALDLFDLYLEKEKKQCQQILAGLPSDGGEGTGRIALRRREILEKLSRNEMATAYIIGNL